jgi:hypothetical protein
MSKLPRSAYCYYILVIHDVILAYAMIKDISFILLAKTTKSNGADRCYGNSPTSL